jgi:hypothetical protein
VGGRTVVSIGIRHFGLATHVDDSEVPIRGVIYETRSELDNPPPAGQELDFLYYIKQEIENREHVSVVFAEVVDNVLVVQWKSLGSPISILVIVGIIALAILVYTLTMLAHETYKIVSVIGPETISMIMQILLIFVVLQMMSGMTAPATRR